MGARSHDARHGEGAGGDARAGRGRHHAWSQGRAGAGVAEPRAGRGPDQGRKRGRRTSKLAGSTSRRIAWDLWVRKAGAFVAFDVVLLAALMAAFVVQCNQVLPAEAFRDTWRLIYAPEAVPGFIDAADGVLNVAYQVTYQGVSYTFALSGLYALVVAVFCVVGACQLVSLCDGVFAARRIRRRLKPLNELALTVEAMGSDVADNPLAARAAASDKFETLRHAIDAADVDAPNVSTGDADLRSIEVALNGLLRQMQQAKLQQMQFVDDASHELRTPIAVLQGYVNMLDRWGKSDPEVLEESIEALKQESAHMQELVEQLLFLARGDAGRTNLHLETFDAAALLAEVCDESAMIDAAHEYRLVQDGVLRAASAPGEAQDASCGMRASGQAGPPLAEVSLVGDVTLVKQALRILVQNAAKYSPAGSAITLGVSTTGGAGAAGQACAVSLSVEDEGVGMRPEDLPHVFERFWRADEARERGVGGTGLGLSIAKWIAEAHEGTIGVVSLAGVGTRFTLELPAPRA